MSNWALLALLFIVANLPWLSSKLFYVLPIKKSGVTQQSKHFGWSLLELIVLYFAMGAVVRYAEHAIFGQVASQGWEFYAVTACIFLVFSFPGFVYRTMWKK
ncbi:MAG: DUF2818 family protein [Methylotenera sp.]|nr:DUF2818 family protein [Methylotenera sp.]